MRIAEKSLPRRLVTAMTASSIAATPGMALAESAQVDATATLVANELPLSITGIRALDFGEVGIPRNSSYSCVYEKRTDGSLENLKYVSSTFLTPAAHECTTESSIAGTLALFAIVCEPNLALDVFIELQGPSAPGTVLNLTGLVDISGQSGQLFCSTAGSEGTGVQALNVAGQLFVSSDATPSSGSVSLGTILAEVYYQ